VKRTLIIQVKLPLVSVVKEETLIQEEDKESVQDYLRRVNLSSSKNENDKRNSHVSIVMSIR